MCWWMKPNSSSPTPVRRVEGDVSKNGEGAATHHFFAGLRRKFVPEPPTVGPGQRSSGLHPAMQATNVECDAWVTAFQDERREICPWQIEQACASFKQGRAPSGCGVSSRSGLSAFDR